MRKLIIVESPSKAKTISNFLKGYNVIASKGHISDLPKFRLGINIDTENGIYTPQYEITPDHKALVNEILKLSKDSKVYLATDEDREGEAIAWHLANVLGGNIEDYDRIVFHEITKGAIEKALNNPRKLDMNAINAQQTRRMLDRIVGFKLSGLVRSKVNNNLSVGRVQSAALKLIIDRERTIKDFKPVIYYEFNTIFKPNIEAKLYSHKGKTIPKQSLQNKDDAINILNSIKNDNYLVGEIKSSIRMEKPKPPFMTSTLQQTASSTLGFSPKKTMEIAQKLYEGVDTPDGIKGVITYMRTDSLNLAEEAVSSVRSYITNTLGKDYLPDHPRSYITTKKGAQEAHEAIRVTDISFTPKIAERYLNKDQLKLYNLIYNRYVACQLPDAKIETKKLFINGKENIFSVNGRTILYPGWMIIDPNKEDVELPNLKQGDKIEIKECNLEEKQTEPPARFNEASLIKELEDKGIGRPSTYATTTTLLINREYVNKENKALVPTNNGFSIVEFLEKYFPEIVNIEFTANMEEKLDLIASNEEEYMKVMHIFCGPLLDKITKGAKEIISTKPKPKLAGTKCPKCGLDMYIRTTKKGIEFKACSGYPKCKYSEFPKMEQVIIKPCNTCNGSLVVKIFKGRKFLGCSNYPNCKHTEKYVEVKEENEE